MVNSTKEIEIGDLTHNHPDVVPRKESGERRRLRKIMAKMQQK